MTLTLSLYRAFAQFAFEPLAPFFLARRVAKGKERRERIPERFGRSGLVRPAGPLVWLHGASVGESQLLLDFLSELRELRPELNAVVTSHTLTSADMVAKKAPDGVVHQMALIDTPASVGRFLDHWRPDVAVIAEGEIWPNTLMALRGRQTPCALINARMTTKSLKGWKSRPKLARDLFGSFAFIGAADAQTADGLSDILGARPSLVGNLKEAAVVPAPPDETVDAWRASIGDRKIVLAASTHEGEEAFALAAFATLRETNPDALLIIAPRHPGRGSEVLDLVAQGGLRGQLRSQDAGLPGAGVDVLVANTIGEMLLWYVLSDAVYLGGATSPNIGGHNAIEPAVLHRRVFTGPEGFNFRDTFGQLERLGALQFGDTSEALCAFWLAEIATTKDEPDTWAPVDAYFAQSREPMSKSVEAVLGLLDAPIGAGHA